MSNMISESLKNNDESAMQGSRRTLGLIGLGLAVPLVACGQRDEKMKEYTVLGVEVFSFVDRVLTTITFNGHFLGVMNKFGGTGLITDIRIPYGIQTLTFKLDGPAGMPRNGETMTVQNTLVVNPEDIPQGTRYLGLNIYPDFTAEITFSEDLPDPSTRGQQLTAERKKNGQMR